MTARELFRSLKRLGQETRASSDLHKHIMSITQHVDRTAAAAHSAADRQMLTLSALWIPWGAGKLVTAMDIPEQTQLFTFEDGEITLTCRWQGAYQTTPATLHVAWQANLHRLSDIWLRFTRPDQTVVLADLRLGTRLIGEETFTLTDLGFDPSQEAWALTILLREL